MSEYIIQGSTLTGIADAIREKTDISRTIDPTEMAALISGISVGGEGGRVVTGTWVGETPDATSKDSLSFTHYWYKTFQVSCPFKPTIFIAFSAAENAVDYDDTTYDNGTTIYGCSMFACVNGEYIQPTPTSNSGYKLTRSTASETYDAETETLTYTLGNPWLTNWVTDTLTCTWIAVE